MTIPVTPPELATTGINNRILWLLRDAENDDRMAGVPRYEPSYTQREQELISYIRYLWSECGGGV